MMNWIKPAGTAITKTPKHSVMTATLLITLLNIGCGTKGQPEEIFSGQDETVGIVGGSPVTTADPIAASTVAVLDVASGQAICTGTLIASNLVITAAHCTEDGLTSLAVGFGTRLSFSGPGAMVVRRVTGGKVHPDWAKLTPDKEKNWGDLAILKFSGTVPAGFRPAPLVTSKTQLTNGKQVTLAGFGLIDMIRQIETDRLRKATVVVSNADFSETEIVFNQFQGRGACHGDSGGPAFIKSGKGVLLAGVTSRSATERGGANCLEGSVYTSVPGQLRFIQTTISALSLAQ